MTQKRQIPSKHGKNAAASPRGAAAKVSAPDKIGQAGQKDAGEVSEAELKAVTAGFQYAKGRD